MNLRRLPWTVISHGFSAASNAAAVVVAAHRLSERDLGSASLVITAVVLVQAAARCITGQPLMIQGGGTDRAALRRGAAAVTLWLSLLVAVPIAATAAWWGSPALALALAVGTVALLGQDLLRYLAFVTRRSWIAAASDATWLVAFVVPAWAAPSTFHTTTSILTLWIAAAAVGAVVALVPLGRSWWTARGVSAQRFVRDNRRLALGLLGDMAVVTAYGNATPFVVAGLASVAAAGDYRVGLTAVGPVSVVVTGMSVQALSDLSRARAAGTPMGPARRRLALRLGAMTGAYTAAVALVPRRLGEAAFGDAWSSARDVSILLAASAITTAIVTPAIISIRAHAATGAAFRLRLVLLPVQAGGVVLGALWWGAAGAAAGLMLGNLVSVVPWWRLAARLDATAS